MAQPIRRRSRDRREIDPSRRLSDRSDRCRAARDAISIVGRPVADHALYPEGPVRRESWGTVDRRHRPPVAGTTAGASTERDERHRTADRAAGPEAQRGILYPARSLA